MKSVSLVLLLLLSISVKDVLLSSKTTNSEAISAQNEMGVIVRDGLRKYAPWRIRLDKGKSVRVYRPFDRLNSNALERHVLPSRTAGHDRLMSHTRIAPSTHSSNQTVSNTTLLHDVSRVNKFLGNIMSMKKESSYKNKTLEAINLIHDEETKLIKEFYEKKLNLSKMKSFFLKFNANMTKPENITDHELLLNELNHSTPKLSLK